LSPVVQVAACRLAPFSIRVNTVSPTAIAESVRSAVPGTACLARSGHHGTLKAAPSVLQPLLVRAREANPMGAEAAMQVRFGLSIQHRSCPA
jgi:NAD(P)-dependent dehydrogenase (short-subunit alcohol dehydrogenase family)